MTTQRHDKFEELQKGEAALRASGAVAAQGNVKILTSCPSCLQGLSRFGDDLNNGLLEADYIVVEMANQILGKDWMPAYVEAANHGGIRIRDSRFRMLRSMRISASHIVSALTRARGAFAGQHHL